MLGAFQLNSFSTETTAFAVQNSRADKHVTDIYMYFYICITNYLHRERFDFMHVSCLSIDGMDLSLLSD